MPGAGEPEVLLEGGTANRGLVVRIGDTVRRPQRPTSPATHALLRHLADVGFTGAPRFLGVDEHGREVLSFLPGEVSNYPPTAAAASPTALVTAVEGHWGDGRADRFVVLTGGEPMLQVDDALVDALHVAGFRIAIESNGTLPAHPGIDWVCISPKAGSSVVQRSGDELKLVWPQAGINVDELEGWDFRHRLIQPLDDAAAPAHQEAAIALVMTRPSWRLSLQTHKLLGLR